MRMFASAALAAAFLGAASAAYAADATGKIKSFDMTKDFDHLGQWLDFHGAKTTKLSDFKVGQKVTVSYTKSGDKMDVTSIKPAT